MMATTVSTAKPSTPYHAAAGAASAAGGKVKRPVPSQQQSQQQQQASSNALNVNGVKAQSQLSGAGKPPGSKQMPNGTGVVVNGVNGKNVAAARRKESQKNEDAVARLLRTTGRTDGERRGKISPEPCVKTTGYILKKYKGCAPSFTIHLHPTHFRFDQQDGSFSYNSEMKFIIEHIKAGTVPHDMVEELIKGGVRFYEGCLIVRVVDHKTVSARSDTKSPSGEKIVPFSMHNYNLHITASPYAPFPKHVQDQLNLNPVTNGTGKPSEPSWTDNANEAESKNKTKAAVDGNGDVKPKVFTTVLHPTPLSLQAEIALCALTPDPRAPKKPRPSQANATSSVSSSSDRPAKRQKMMVEPDELPEFEAKLIRATAPPLYLEPVDSREACQKLLDMLQSPLHCNKPPSPKVRRRTVAELAADEAAAAEEERFMLIMDERLELAASSTTNGPKSAAVDDEGGAAPFEPRFSRFKTLENIRAQHEEKAKREQERKLQQDQVKRQQQDAEREKRRILEARQATEAAREETRKQFLAQQQAQQQQAQQALQNQHAQAQAQAAQAQMAARRPPSQGSAAGFPPQMVSTQGPQSSPIVRNATPHAGSPLAANMMGTQPGQMPTTMGMTTQGAGSPLQVSSGLQHGHPGVPMAHPMVASRSQQSAHGTPQMAHGTPAIAHSTPIMGHSTPQRMTHASPNGSAVAPTPVMNLPVGGQINGSGMLTPQQQQALIARQLQLAQQGIGHQFSPQQLAQLHAQQALQQQRQQQQHAGMQFPNQQQAYQQQILRSQLAQMQMSQQGQLPQQQMLAANQQVNGMGQPRPKPAPSPYHVLYNNHLLRLRKEWAHQHLSMYGSPQTYSPEIRKEFNEVTDNMAKRIVSDIMRKDREEGNPRAQQYEQLQAHLRMQQQQRLQQAQAQAQAQAMQQQQQLMNGMVNGMGK